MAMVCRCTPVATPMHAARMLTWTSKCHVYDTSVRWLRISCDERASHRDLHRHIDVPVHGIRNRGTGVKIVKNQVS